MIDIKIRVDVSQKMLSSCKIFGSRCYVLRCVGNVMGQSRRNQVERESVVNAKIDVVMGTSSIAMSSGHFDGMSLKK